MTSRREEILLVRKRHEIYAGLTGKDVLLVSSDPPGRTDTVSYISVPTEDPEVGLIHAHEWDHIIWKTNLYARARFVEQYVHELEMKGMLDPFNMAFSGKDVRAFVDLVTNALDDVRVTSCRSLIWPGEADRIWARWSRLAASSKGENFVLRLLGLASSPSDAPLPGAGGRWMDEPMLEAIRYVTRAGYAKVLIATRNLIDVCTFLRPNTPDEEPLVPAPVENVQRLSKRRAPQPENRDGKAALQRLISHAMQAVPKIVDATAPTKPDPSPAETERMVQTAMSQLSTEMAAKTLEEGDTDVETVASTLRNSTLRDTAHDLTRDIPKVSLVDLGSSDVEQFDLPPEDEVLVEQIRHVAAHLHDMRKRRRSEEGTELVPERYIEFMTGGSDSAFFVEDSLERGFSCLMLQDMSGSMLQRWRVVSRAAKVLVKALKFPFSQLEVWGFSGTSTGQTAIFRFKDPEKGIMPVAHHREMWGLTPLHVALTVAARRVSQMPGRARHLMVITDGHPQHIGGFGPGFLREAVFESVREALSMGVRVNALILGNSITDDQATSMFGEGHWRRIDEHQDSLFNEMVDLVRGAFLHYLRRG